MTYSRKKGMVPLRSERFGDRVTFAGNLDKNDLSIVLSDVQLEDEGIYNCYVRNPPDRIQGHGAIQFKTMTKRRYRNNEQRRCCSLMNRRRRTLFVFYELLSQRRRNMNESG